MLNSVLKTNDLFGVGPKTRTNRRFLKTRPDARTDAQKEDVSGETRTYMVTLSHSVFFYAPCHPPLLEESNSMILSHLASFSQSFPGSVGHECSSRKHVFDNSPDDQQQTSMSLAPHKLNYTAHSYMTMRARTSECVCRADEGAANSFG
jgi:hypothetical protein